MVKILACKLMLNTNRTGGKFLKLTDNKQTELLPLLISIQQPSPDFACSRRGLGKGGRCHAVATDLKMVYIPCYVSITTVTCLRERLRKWRGKRDVATEIIFMEQRPKRTTRQCQKMLGQSWLDSFWPHHFQLCIALVKRHLRPGVSFPSTV